MTYEAVSLSKLANELLGEIADKLCEPNGLSSTNDPFESFKHAPDAVKGLISLSLSCSTLRSIAQQRLFRHLKINLKDKKMIRKFLAWRTPQAKKLKDHVKALAFYNDPGASRLSFLEISHHDFIELIENFNRLRCLELGCISIRKHKRWFKDVSRLRTSSHLSHLEALDIGNGCIPSDDLAVLLESYQPPVLLKRAKIVDTIICNVKSYYL